MTGPLARIVARYLAGILVTYGLVAQDIGQTIATDPDFIALIGACVAAVTEVVYAQARKKGWAT